MNRILTPFFFLTIFFVQHLHGQESCTFRLELSDSGGDGWSNAFLTVLVDGEGTSYTLNTFNDNGTFRAFDIDIPDGAEVTLNYTPGFAENENSYAIYGPEGTLIFSDGPIPNTGEIFTVQVSCPSCQAPSSRLITLNDVRHNRADISWVAPGEGRYVVEYDTAGFMQGMGRTLETGGEMIRIPDLSERTDYEFYLYRICESGDTSTIQGPVPFTTLWANDVGITEILEPVSACGLFVDDTVRVGLTNFGGAPQTLIPFRYAVNGVPVNIPDPFDGLFTGVVGNDSTSFIDFETTYDFSQPGEYVITAWTELENDAVAQNDTAEVTVINIPIVTQYPYFQNFEQWGGGWTVDTNSIRPSWQHGRPGGRVIERAGSGEQAWVTNLDGPYNAGELSYLVSPCLDFSSFVEDPRLSFSLFYVTEECCDSGWVEVSTDGGESWDKVGTSGTGLNWYNQPGDYWSGDASDKGWTFTYHTLDGTAGASDVRLRFVFASDNSLELEGFGVDNVLISNTFARDLAAVSVSNNSDEECGAMNDQVALNITNVGTEAVSGFDVGYRINGGAPVIENVGNLTLAPNEEATYVFNTTFDSREAGSFDIVAWTSLNGEGFINNDTARIILNIAEPLPFVEDFEAGIIPPGWDTGDAIVTNSRNNVSFVLADNLFSGDQEFSATTPAIGPVEASDTLMFDYRFVLQAGGGTDPKELTAGESLQVQISTDCGETYATVFTIDASNHNPTADLTTVGVSLEDFAGEVIKIRFLANWEEGDFWVDLDNVNILQCPASLQLDTEVQNESSSGRRDGQASVTPAAGFAPYTYAWSTGDTTKTIFGLSAGIYQVTVTDRFGCEDVAEIEVGVGVSTDQVRYLRDLQLAPNPTTGRSHLRITFTEAVEVEVQVLNLVGQTVFNSRRQRARQVDYAIDLSKYTGGLYLLRIRMNDQVHTEKLLLIKR